jgi:hypothetical protein
MATLALLPCFAFGLWNSKRLLRQPARGIRCLLSPGSKFDFRSRQGLGRICLLLVGMGKIGGGAVIMAVGMTTVFVPQDLVYLQISPSAMSAINPHLVPLIAHDRAGFGGGLLSCGVIVLLVVWKAPMSRSLWQALLLAGCVGFACAIGIHYQIGYVDLLHLAPAWAGAAVFMAGIVMALPRGARNRV